ncbi:hypothetical protein BOX15_Mlig025872g2 [Macrostomum lignano]|uniref:Uncharacterized protein n=1 Tax=Macrostomum lignano TaxID=282301 RepID=A0A267GEY0_9PLAT|nr:hypothetical protein BOX15_Mlig025872g2 [Macrostomum lignano]
MAEHDNDEEDLFAYLSVESLRQFQPSSSSLLTTPDAAVDGSASVRGFHLALLDHCASLRQLPPPADPALLSVLSWFAESPAFVRLLGRLSRALRFRQLARLCRQLESVAPLSSDAAAIAVRLVDTRLPVVRARLLRQLLTGADSRRLALSLARCRFLLRRASQPAQRRLLLPHCRLPDTGAGAAAEAVWRDCLLRRLLAASLLPKPGESPAAACQPRLAARCLLQAGGPSAPAACVAGCLRLLARSDRLDATVHCRLRLLAELTVVQPALLASAADRLTVRDRRRLRCQLAELLPAAGTAAPMLHLLARLACRPSAVWLAERLGSARRLLGQLLAGRPLSEDADLADRLADVARRRLRRRCLDPVLTELDELDDGGGGAAVALARRCVADLLVALAAGDTAWLAEWGLGCLHRTAWLLGL